MDKMRGEGRKMSVFVHGQGIKTVHAGEKTGNLNYGKRENDFKILILLTRIPVNLYHYIIYFLNQKLNYVLLVMYLYHLELQANLKKIGQKNYSIFSTYWRNGIVP